MSASTLTMMSASNGTLSPPPPPSQTVPAGMEDSVDGSLPEEEIGAARRSLRNGVAGRVRDVATFLQLFETCSQSACPNFV